MATKSATKARKKQAHKSGRKTATRKKATETKPAASKTSDDSQALVVFAFRLTREERDLIHKTAGPAKASRLVKGAALAAANQDVDAFRAVIAETLPAKS